jgi:hypothetical protein
MFLGFLLIHAFFPGLASTQTPYNEGKTITILRGGSPGGYGTLQTQALMPFLKNISRGIRSFSSTTCQGPLAGRQQILFTHRPNRMGLLLVLWATCW